MPHKGRSRPRLGLGDSGPGRGFLLPSLLTLISPVLILEAHWRGGMGPETTTSWPTTATAHQPQRPMIDSDLALSDLIGATPGRGRRRPVLVETPAQIGDGLFDPLVILLGIDNAMTLENPGPGNALL